MATDKDRDDVLSPTPNGRSQGAAAALPQARQDDGMGREQLLPPARSTSRTPALDHGQRLLARLRRSTIRPSRSSRRNLAEASRNFPEMMFALAVLDLPFEAGKHETKFDGAKMTLTAGEPAGRLSRRDQAGRSSADEADPDSRQPELLPPRRPPSPWRTASRSTSSSPKSSWSTPSTAARSSSPIRRRRGRSSTVLLQIPAGRCRSSTARRPRRVASDAASRITRRRSSTTSTSPRPASSRTIPVHVAKNEDADRVRRAVRRSTSSTSRPRSTRESWDYVSQHGTRRRGARVPRRSNNVQRSTSTGSPSG